MPISAPCQLEINQLYMRYIGLMKEHADADRGVHEGQPWTVLGALGRGLEIFVVRPALEPPAVIIITYPYITEDCTELAS